MGGTVTMDEPVIPRALEDKLLKLIGEREFVPAVLKMVEETGMDQGECALWVKKRIPQYVCTTPCPYCGAILRSDKAKQCLTCGVDWHDPEKVTRHGPGNS
jgi:hypothetical protein